MARRKRTNPLIIASLILLITAVLGYGLIYSYKPQGEIWHELQQGCIVLAGIAAVIWAVGIKKRNKDNG